MTTNRLEYFSELSTAARSPDRHLILDRYYVSGTAYGCADGLSLDYLESIHSFLPEADITFLVDITPEASVARRPIRRDEYESRAGFLSKVRALYLGLFNKYSKRDPSKWVVINGEYSEEVVHDAIFAAVATKIKTSV